MEEYLVSIFTVMLESEKHLAGKSIEVCFVDGESIRSLNKKYFGRDNVTDILAFNNQCTESTSIGELIINSECTDTAKMNNRRFTVSGYRKYLKPQHTSFSDLSLAKLFIHGTLHLLGYDHINSAKGESMRDKEEKYLNLIMKTNNHPTVSSSGEHFSPTV